VEKAAAGLAGANLTVLNGSEGMSEIVTSLVGQGMAVFNSLRSGITPDTSSTPQLPAGTAG